MSRTHHTPPPAAAGALARFVRAAARRAARRPKLTVGLWLALIIACVVSGSLAGTRNLSDAGSGVGQSARADARLQAAGLTDPATENILVTSASRSRTTAAVTALHRAAAALPTVATVNAPSLTTHGGRAQLVVVTLRGDPQHADTAVVPLQAAVHQTAAGSPGVRILQVGDASGDRATNQIVNDGLHRAELISLPITLIILIAAFGALVAASVPLLLGVTSVGAALGSLGLLSHIAPNGSSTAPVVVLIGLAVGIDYSLFYIRRERAERDAGAGPDAALDATSATVGRAILVAGATVIVGLAGLLFTGFGVFTSMALGAIVVVAIAVVGSLTVLPAALALLGDRIDRGRLRRRRRTRPPHATAWGRLAAAVTARPRAALAVATVLLAALAAPVLGMHTGESGESELPASAPIVQAAHAIQRAFPGSSNTAELVVSGARLGTPHARAQLAALGRQAEHMAGGHGALTTRVASDGRTALVSVPVPAGSLGARRHVVQRLRAGLLPEVGRRIAGARGEITGGDAQGLDFTNRLAAVTPPVIAFVLALAFGLIVATFGSPLLALGVMALNLLSVGAAFGLLVVVFQHAWAQSLLGFTSSGAITDWLPLFAFVVLFGLSMDYTVLILERAREARLSDPRATARQAAAAALGATGSTVTSAAIVMVAVFSVFGTLPLLQFKQLGVGLAAAIALDATLVRGIALPALLTLLGDRGIRPRRPRRARPAGRRGSDAEAIRWDHPAHVATLRSGAGRD